MTYPQTNNTLERKIHFYRADIGNDAGGRPLDFDPAPALNLIKSLPLTNDSDGYYQSDPDGNALCVVDYSDSDNQHICFYRVRRTGLPQVEQAGSITDLVIDPEAGLAEAVHVVFFPNNIVGAEYNHFGPRVSRLGNYLSEKSKKAVPSATFQPILRGDAAEQLDRLTDLRSLDFSIYPAYAATVRQAEPSLGAAFDANARVLDNPETIQVLLKPGKANQSRFLNKMRNPLKRLVANNGIHENSARLEVKGRCEDTGRVEKINLLNDLLISTQQIVRMNERGRALNHEAAFQAIRDAYKGLSDSLQNASSVSP